MNMMTTDRRRRTVAIDGPDPIDVAVGDRVRTLRILRGISQTQLGHDIGLTFQQVQKYERGKNRISASKLWAIAETLNAPVQWFFRDAGGEPAFDHDGLDLKREALELVRNFQAIEDPAVRASAYALVKSLARHGETSNAAAAAAE